MNARRLMRIFAVLTSMGAYIMLLMGAVVTATGSGHGCGNSWPLCHGQLIPDSLPVATVIEYGHRAISSFDGTCILILTLWSWFTYRQDRLVKLLGFLSLFFVVLQGGLGALTVVFEGTWAQNAFLALHFGFSLISFASVILLTIRLFQMKKEGADISSTRDQHLSVGKRLPLAVWSLTAFTYLVVYTGSLVRHYSAVLGCGKQIPGCGSTYFPTLTSLAGIQVLHRYAAAIIWFLVLWFFIVAIRRYRERGDLVKGGAWAFILVTLQALSGMTIIFSGGQLMIALVHTTIISAFFSVLCYLCMQVGWPWKRHEQDQPLVQQRVQAGVS